MRHTEDFFEKTLFVSKTPYLSMTLAAPRSGEGGFKMHQRYSCLAVIFYYHNKPAATKAIRNEQKPTPND
jgi:hypothetical protein